uniref:Uncharacterized protein n=1 Tax=Trichogramma kaykai TaxID=54128 RepID=A0ABD2XEQ5_9HYME
MSATATRPVDIPAPLNIIYGTSRELASCSCGMMHLTKRIEEVRLLESRKSARLADSDTDFARLADVGSDRKRASSHSIDVSTFIGRRAHGRARLLVALAASRAPTPRILLVRVRSQSRVYVYLAAELYVYSHSRGAHTRTYTYMNIVEEHGSTCAHNMHWRIVRSSRHAIAGCASTIARQSRAIYIISPCIRIVGELCSWKRTRGHQHTKLEPRCKGAAVAVAAAAPARYPGQLPLRVYNSALLLYRRVSDTQSHGTDPAPACGIGSPRMCGSRKRRPSSSNDSERSYNAWNDSTNNNNNNNNNSSHNHNHHQQQHHNNNNRQTSVVTSTQAQSPVAVAPVQATQTSTGGGSSATTTGAMNLSMTASSGGSEPQETVYMDECSAAMVLMSLSTPPKNPLPIHCQQSYGSWDDGISNRVTIGSPGTNSSQSSSSASWRSATPSPPLSDDPISHSAAWAAAHPNNHHNNHHQLQHQQQHHHHNNHHSQTHQSPGQVPVVDQRRFYHRQHHPYAVVHRSSSHRRHRGGGLSSSSSSPNNSPYDEGIVPDLDQERPRKKRIRSIENDEDYMSANNTGSSSDNDVYTCRLTVCVYKTVHSVL